VNSYISKQAGKGGELSSLFLGLLGEKQECMMFPEKILKIFLQMISYVLTKIVYNS
jgi:hypothetical protein